MDNTSQLKARIAALESQVDLQEAELMHLHEMLIRCGFSEGIKTLKATVEEYLAEENQFSTQKKQSEII
jgi:uncharacterized coiled-coil protein SlyX